MKEYEVWMEGYATTGNSDTAHLVGRVEAKSFQQACHILMCREYLETVKNGTADNEDWLYNPRGLSYWACRMFPTEEEARKNFG